MKRLTKLIALAAVAITPIAAMAASPAKAAGFRECEPGEINCQCGFYIDTSRGLKNTTVRPQYC